MSVSHTVSGSDRLLTVCVVFDDTSTSVSNVTFGGVALTKVTQVLHSGGKPRVELWRLLNPAVSTANVAVTLSSAKKTTVGVISFTGVDQTTPIDGTTPATGTTNTATVNVSSASGDLVVDCMGTIASPSTTPTVGASQTSRWTREQGGSIRGAGSTEAGAASVTMSWGLPESKEWATIGFNVNAQLCGNGVVNGGESCDDGANNGTTASCCTTTCAYKTAGTACGSSSDTICDNPDTCNGAGTCLTNNEPNTTVCRGDAGACDVAETCNGSGACPADAFEPAGTSCGDTSDGVCDDPDTCDGSGACQSNFEPNTTVCREDAGACDVAENCDGAGACPADAFEDAGTSCGDTSDGECDDPDTCDSAGACVANHAVAGLGCGDPDDSQCDHPDTCDGSGTCATNYEASGAACGDGSSSTCDQPDSCNGSGACQDNHEPATTVCRAATGVCDVAETCDGLGACPTDAFEDAGSACGDPSDSICDDPDTCDGNGACAQNHAPDTVECRTDAGHCDVAETCDGLGACPADAFESEGTSCGNPTGTVCDDPDTCDAAGNCLVNNAPDTTLCRADAGDCDVAEFCDGAGACPTDAFENAGTACGDPSDVVCDHADTCDGSGACLDNLEPAATVCRAATGECDVEETCDGSGACPADALAIAGTACGDPTDGECDDPDACDGSGTCLANHEPAATACGDSADSACDNPDSCDGSGTCAANAELDGTSCQDGAFCNGADSCVAGQCAGHAGDPCAGADGDGDCSESCDEVSDSCSGNDTDGAACDDGNVCSTGEQCSGGSCSGGSTTDCDDGDLCTADTCDPEEGCVNVGEPLDASFCLDPGKFSFAVKDAGDPTKNTLQWKWNKGEPVDPADLGSPTSTTGYALCVYDHSAGVPELVGSYVVPSNPTLWTTKPGQMKYVDKAGSADGITSLKGKASLDPFKSGMGVKGKGSFLTIPGAFSADLYFDLDPRLTVQLRNDEGACWTSDLVPANVKKNTGVLFKATGP